MGENQDEYRSRFEIKSKDSDEAWSSLINLCKVLNKTSPEEIESALEPLLDIDGALWFLAADVALINSDGYWTRASDYSIYQDKQSKFHILPHDMNEAFRAKHGGPGRGGPGGPDGGRFRGGPQGTPPGPPRGERGGPRPPEQFNGSDSPSRQRRPNQNPRSQGDQRSGPPGPPDQPQRRSGQDGRPPGNEGDASGGGFELDPLVGIDDDRFPLRSKLLANEQLRIRYLQ